MVRDVIGCVKKNRDSYFPIMITLVIGIFLGVRFDFYYDINDDVLIHDILSGNYTGTPEGHNIQILYPLSFVIALCYKLIREIPWYGLFLCGCQFGCLYLIVQRTISYGKGFLEKLLLLIASTSIFLIFQYNTLVMVQYTVVAGLLASTSIFLFVTSVEVLDTKEMLKKNRVSIILLMIAFCLREEMTLLLLPILCVAGVTKWIYERSLWSIKTLKKYCILLVLAVSGLGVCMGMHQIAYSSDEWRTFQDLFDQRTILYDYAVVPEYDEHQDFYERIGIEEPQQRLLVNYNYAIDSTIDVYKMTKTATYASNIRKEEFPFFSRLRQSISEYKYRFLNMEQTNLERSDYPYNLMIIILYSMVVILVMITKRFRYGIVLALLIVVRSGLWIYIIYGLRTPLRITVPLYFAECCVLFGVLLELVRQEQIKKYYGILIVSGILIVGIMSTMPYLHQELLDSIHQKEVFNQAHEDIRDYAKLYPDNVYLIDVYTYVPFSEKIFEERNNLLDNYGIIGGWAAGSPLEMKRLMALNALEIDQSLIKEEHVLLVNATKYSLNWLEDYYRMRGISIMIERVAELTSGTIEIVKINQLIE